MPQKGDISAKLDGNKLTGTWKTDIQTEGTFTLMRTETFNSYPADYTMTWREFREWVLDKTNENPSLIFRGHDNNQYSLVTSFHRTGRRNLLRYEQEDLQRLCRHIEATLGTSYDLGDRMDFSELLYLGQHHGFPTPLLDWTESPFIAASFAFHKLPTLDYPKNHHIRIFMFDPTGWPHGQVNSIADVAARFAALYPRARANPRALPQQSVAMFCNLVQLEKFTQHTE